MSASAPAPAEAGEIITRRAPAVTASTWNEDARTIEVVWAAGAKVPRRSWEDGPFIEELDMRPEAVVLDRLQGGASVLNSHAAFDMGDRIGTVLPGSARISGGKGIATIKISRNALGEAIAQDLKDGHPLAISVGYRILRSERTEGVDGALPVIKATLWEPLELSCVPVPADPNAKSRNLERSPLMDDELTLETPARQAAPRPARILPKAETRRAFAARHGLDGEDLLRVVAATEGATEQEVRAAVQDELVRRQEKTESFPHVSMRTLEGGDRFTGMEEAIRARLQPSFRASASAAPFLGLSFVEMARRSLEIAGRPTNGMHGANVVDAALGQRNFMTTTDFGPALGNAFRAILLDEFEALQSPIAKAFRSETTTDFRDLSFIHGVAGSDLVPVNEHGEFRRGPLLGESAETARLGTYGRVTALTRQVIVNDQLGAIARFIDEPAKKAAELEANLMILQLESSTVTMSDGRPLFHQDHQNLSVASSTLTEESLEAAILQVEKGHRHANGSTIFQRPKFLIVPSELRLTATKLLAAVQATRTADVNPMTNVLELIVEPRLSSSTSWYVAADPQRSAGGIALRLAGQEKPFIDYRTGFDVDGLEIKVRHDFGAGFADFRSWFKNPGA